MIYFDTLGQRVEHVWRQRHYDEEVFADLAHELLSAHPPPPHVTPGAIARWLLGQAALPMQSSLNESFGQPPLTVYRGRRFFIDVYFWVDGTTTIHQHGFAGAFHLLAGSSIHGRYTFRTTRRVSDAMLIGDLELSTMDLLAAGTTHRILPFDDLIHSLFHLERPSVTVVVRTRGTSAHPPSYIYRRPGVAIDPFLDDAVMTKVLQVVTMLHRIDHPERRDMLFELLERSDLHTTYLVLHRCLELADLRMAAIEPYLMQTSRLHGEDAARRLADAFREEARQETLNRMRLSVRDPEQRFMLGVLRNAPGRDTARRLVAQRHPGVDPDHILARVASALAGLGDTDAAALAVCLEGGEATEPLARSPLLEPLLRPG